MKLNRQNCVVVAAVLACLAASTVARAATYYVATNGNDANAGTQAQPFQTIGRGMASAQDGDTVLVANGVYSGGGNWYLSFQGKNFTLRSQGGAANCIMDADTNPLPGFAFRSGDTRAAVLDGFTIRNSRTSPGISINAGSPTIANCIISDNRSNFGGGISVRGSPLIQGCTITGNLAERGGGMEISGGNPTIVNCTFSNNAVIPNTVTLDTCFGGAINIYNGSSATIANCMFTQNGASYVYHQAGGLGGALSATDSNVTIADCTFNANSAASGGGGVYVAGGSVTLIGCTLSANRASEISTRGDGGGMLLEGGGNGTIINCLFVGNQAVNEGGGILVGYQYSTLTVANCTFTGNQAPSIGGIRSSVFQHNVLVMNNSIVYNNPGGEVFGFDTSTVGYSDVGGGFTGSGNINADPLFALAYPGDYHLQQASPCINAGSAAVPGLPSTDLGGAPRTLNGAPDMGAYESTTGNWFVDAALGNDANIGTPAMPFQTVTRAVTVATHGQSVFIRQGSYGTDRPRITKTLRLINWGDTGQVRIGQP